MQRKTPLKRTAFKRTKKVVRKKTPTKTALRKKCDTRFSEYIRKRDGKCQRCHTEVGLQCAHVISRRYLAIRYNDLNAMALCARCHLWQTHNPLEGDEFFKEQIGALIFEELRRLALARSGPPEYATILGDLTARLAAL